MVPVKNCNRCSEIKPISEFSVDRRSRDGVQSRCKSCYSMWYRKNRVQILSERSRSWHADVEKSRASRRSTRDQAKHRSDEKARGDRYAARTAIEVYEARTRLRPTGAKTCRKCKVEKCLSQFGVASRSADGLRSECRDCRSLSPSRLVAIASFPDRGLVACVYCGGEWRHVDHVWPVKLGGQDVKDNLVPACADCNRRKSARNPWQWMSQMYPGVDHALMFESWGVDWKSWDSR